MNTKSFLLEQELSGALSELRKSTIGFYNCPSGVVEMVIEEGKHTFTTIEIPQLLGMKTNYYPKDNYTFIKFPDNKTFDMMLLEPLEFNNWFNDNVKGKVMRK